MADDPRTSLLASADAPAVGRLRRLERFWFRQRPLRTTPPAAAQSLNARAFQPTEEGSGNLGRWIVDEAGLPAYQYEMDQHDDVRAAYATTEGFERRDHWHQVGNRRLTALASNDGVVQVYLGDRGGVFLNRFEAWAFERPQFRLRQFLYRILRTAIGFVTRVLRRVPPVFSPFASPAAKAAGAASRPLALPRGTVTPELAVQLAPQHGLTAQTAAAQSAAQAAARPDPAAIPYAYAGGFGYVDDGSDVWATAYGYRPAQSQTRRVFGMGYFESEVTHRQIHVRRRVYAPHGDSPFLIAEVELWNANPAPAALRHYEYWDVNVHQLQLAWMRSGPFGPISDGFRRDVNKHFAPSLQWDEAANTLRFRQALREPRPAIAKPPHEPSDIDWDPAHVFLADLNDGPPNALFVDKKTFFGAGGVRRPDAVAQRRPGDPLIPGGGGDPMPYCLVMRRDLVLEPDERRTLRYAYGTVRPDQTMAFLSPYLQPNDAFGQTLAAWKDQLAYFDTGQDPVLHREMAWHAYYLLSATVYLDFFKAHVVPQGSAYLYLHGADGAPRDQALFVLSAVYLDPALARDMLRLIMQVTDAQSGQITYAFCGNGFLSNGLDLHTNPSDLDLFLLLALCEYLCATGDFAFLSEAVPFYPPEASPPGATVLDHVRKALWHLFEVNGIGDHGLVKVGSGDWSDSIVLETALRDGIGPFGVTYLQSKKHGESVPNTQMALYVLPLLANLLQDHDPALRDLIYDAPSQPDRLERMRAAVQAQWNPNGWYNRAVLRSSRNHPVVVEQLTLEAQAWALISADPAEAGRTAQVIERIDQVLDRPSPVGAALVAGGMVWPAVSQLLTWGYCRTGRHPLAWRSLNRHTYAIHSTVYPNLWLNTWSGPDGVNGPAAALPGWTWSSLVTPMTDFPVMNANQDAMSLLGLLRVCGIEPAPAGDGLLIEPHVPRDRFVLDLPLIRLEVSPDRMVVEYRAAATGRLKLYLRHGAGAVNVLVDGAQRDDLAAIGDQVVVPIQFVSGQVVRVEVVSSA